MAVIKIKTPNGQIQTYNLTENAQDTGGNYIRVRFNGQDLYARVSGNVTPLNVVKSNGDRGYVQYDPITFNTWKWEARNVESFNNGTCIYQKENIVFLWTHLMQQRGN